MIFKMLAERRARQIKIQDHLVDLENKIKELYKLSDLQSVVIEVCSKEILTIKALLNKNGMNDSVVNVEVTNEQH